MNTHTLREWREIEAAWDRQDMQLKSEADDRSAARAACEAIRAIRECDLTPQVAAQIAAALSARVTASEWSHWDDVEHAIQNLDECVDLLESVNARQ